MKKLKKRYVLLVSNKIMDPFLCETVNNNVKITRKIDLNVHVSFIL